jgi:hypothetical protein
MIKENEHNKQSNFAWFPALAGVGGLFAGWSLFGKKKEEITPNPVLYYALIVILALIIIAAGFLLITKMRKK